MRKISAFKRINLRIEKYLYKIQELVHKKETFEDTSTTPFILE